MLVYEDWFNGKSIAVVGNAAALFDREYGKLIDSHDVVCRMNKGFFDINDSSHGTRTDVLVYSQWATVRRAVKRLTEEVRVSCYLHVSLKGREEAGPTEFFPDAEAQVCPISVIYDLKDKLQLSKKESVSTGITFLEMLAECNTGSVSVFGFDWKKTPTFYTPAKKIKPDPHDFEKEREYCLTTFIESNGFKIYS
jgi:hypothetical protein